MSADYEHPLLDILRKISAQLDGVVERLDSIEQLIHAQGANADEEVDGTRARLARDRQRAAEAQGRAVDAVRRTLSEHDLVSE